MVAPSNAILLNGALKFHTLACCLKQEIPKVFGYTTDNQTKGRGLVAMASQLHRSCCGDVFWQDPDFLQLCRTHSIGEMRRSQPHRECIIFCFGLSPPQARQPTVNDQILAVNEEQLLSPCWTKNDSSQETTPQKQLEAGLEDVKKWYSVGCQFNTTILLFQHLFVIYKVQVSR